MQTLPEDVLDERGARRARWSRRLFLAFVTALVLVGLTGALGVRTTQAIASGDGYTLEVTYASMTRPGLATPYAVEVTSDSFADRFSIEVSATFLDAFDENGLDPEPIASSSDGDWVRWTFEAPEGDTFALSFDARLEPAVQWKRPGTTRLLVDGRVIAAIEHTMWVMP